MKKRRFDLMGDGQRRTGFRVEVLLTEAEWHGLIQVAKESQIDLGRLLRRVLNTWISDELPKRIAALDKRKKAP